jgi:[protein-PII] uridylyltransferase
MSLASKYRRQIEHGTWLAIRESMMRRAPEPPDQESIEAFLTLLSRGGRLADLLRRLHELRVLEQIIPGFKRTRGLLQFNAYHKYTVDVHCLLAVEAACEFESGTSAISRRYRRIADKRLLHLALLIHDLGKGFEEDHCDVGREIALETARTLQLDAESTDTLQWLIHKHLVVNLYAFRHDLSDPEIVHSFAKEVGSIRRLELIIVHTVADLKAVGPDVLTDWKMNLIEDLYLRTRRFFETGVLPGEQDSQSESIRAEVRSTLVEAHAPDACFELLDEIPLSLLCRDAPEKFASELMAISDHLVNGEGTYCTSRFDAQLSAVRYTFVRREGEYTIGTFARATGALTTSGLAILRAEIETVGDYLAWDDFWVLDPDHPGEPPASRTKEVCERLRHLLDCPTAALPPHRKTWKRGPTKESPEVNLLPTKVTFDNETFRRYTILSIFAYDQVGLLYRIAATLAELSVVLHFAKIDTHLDQIADVFYVSELSGEPILDTYRQIEIRDALLGAVNRT